MKHLIKISVEAAYRSNNGWFVDCSDEIERFVHQNELAAHLGADKQGLIPCVREVVSSVWDSEFKAWHDEVDEQQYHVTLTGWLAEHSDSDLEIELDLLINTREDRTIAPPLPGGLRALNGIPHLVKSVA